MKHCEYIYVLTSETIVRQVRCSPVTCVLWRGWSLLLAGSGPVRDCTGTALWLPVLCLEGGGGGGGGGAVINTAMDVAVCM